MNKKLRSILIHIEQLLRVCGRQEDAEMISSVISRMDTPSTASVEREQLLAQLKEFMHPRGVFCDSGLIPDKDSGLSKDDAYARQGSLASEFWSVIDDQGEKKS